MRSSTSPRIRAIAARRVALELFWWTLAAGLAGVVACLLAFWVGSPRAVLWLTPLLGVPMSGAFLWTIRRRKRLTRMAHERDLRVCPACHFPLAREGDPVRCSECGEAWSGEELRQYWWPDHWPPPPPTMYD